MKKAVILIPAFDPPPVVTEYAGRLMENGFRDIIVVNDGSRSSLLFEQLRHMGCVVLAHEKNEGKGKALRTGLSYYRSHYDYNEYAGVITADSDGQHLCRDVVKLARKLEEGGGELILGSRDFSLPQVPPKSRFGNRLTAWIFRYLFRFRVRDTQTGLRGIPNVLIDPCLTLPGDRFEYETAMLTEVGKKSGITEIPIETVYYEENKGTHFDPVRDSLRIYRIIFGRFFRYLLSSLSSFLLDILLFALFLRLLPGAEENRIFLATWIARLFSSVYNFCMNRNVVFKSSESYVSSAFRYFALCVLQGLTSAVLVVCLHKLLRMNEIAVKILVDTALFFVSYQVQKTFIFRKDRKNGKEE